MTRFIYVILGMVVKQSGSGLEKDFATSIAMDFGVGVLICADMRHTELPRELALGRSCDILLQPAAFARDVTYASWQSFVECRALENQVPLVIVHMFIRHTGEGNRFWMVFAIFLRSFVLFVFSFCFLPLYVRLPP